MKKNIIILVVALFVSQIVQAQGTIYLSSLSQTPTGSASVGSDSWLAAAFSTGNDANGYVLNFVQLGLAEASGNPSGFTATINTYTDFAGPLPGDSLGTLNGSLNPVTSGTYTYDAPSNLILSPATAYFIVLTAGTTVANGAYNWNESSYPPSSSGGWAVLNEILKSSDGISDWSPVTPYDGIGQLAINATPIPEPFPSILLLLGSGVFIYARRAFRR